MKDVATFQHKKVVVLGLARSGMSAAKLLVQLGAFVIVNDGKPLSENPEAQELQNKGVQLILGEHPLSVIDESVDYLIKNPGINYDHPLVKKAQKLHIPVLTEVELAWMISDAPIIGITGTNGKTTTTMMIDAVLNEVIPNHAILSGNIGYPASTVAKNVSSQQRLVMELSSFQLKGTQNFHPHIGVITNLGEAHLNYHHTREDYIQSKWNIQQNMTKADYLIYNADQEELCEMVQTTQAQLIPFSRRQVLHKGAYVENGTMYYDDEAIMATSELGVLGDHNIENALMAIAVAKLDDVDNNSIRHALMNFHGVKHRLQFVDEIQGVKYYNDSKATNILATQQALSGFDLRHVILLAGGLDRDVDFAELIPSLQGLKAMVTFGETNELLACAAKEAGVLQVKSVETLEQAMTIAIKWAIVGDSILLSPANASWDQYPDFEARGDEFISLVMKQKDQGATD